MKIALIGYGKMGKAIESIALERGHTITSRYTSSEPLVSESLSNADVAIEFTNPESAGKNIETCINAGVPVIVGSTGWYDRFDELSSLCAETGGSFLHATNFSLGVNLFFKLNKELAKLMNNQDYQPSIMEVHHLEKKDSPSGTAITLAEGLLTNFNGKLGWVNHPTNNKSELEIVSERTPNVPGTHRITYKSDIDNIEIAHIAHNRKGFALGSVVAAEWILGKQGVFSMEDVLNL